jgi:hypothetical protein
LSVASNVDRGRKRIVSVKLLHPALAHERACDIDGAFSEQCIGEPPRDGFVARLDVPSDEFIAANVRRAWWVAHYAGVPIRSEARALALVRAVAFHPEAVAVAFLRRELTDHDVGRKRRRASR